MSASHVFVTESAEQTTALGRALGEVLESGDFIGLSGTLGAGKTQLARGIAEGAGVNPHEVASPTFAILYPYEARGFTLFHADLYRVADEDELYATGFFELFEGPGAFLVEWLDRVPGAAPEQLLRIELVSTGLDRREVRATAIGARPEALLAAWVERAR